MKMLKRTLAMLLCIVMALGLVAVTASAADVALIDTTAKGSITITKYESDTQDANGDGTDSPTIPEGATPLAGVTFTLYKVKSAAEVVAYYNGTNAQTVTVGDYVTDGKINTGIAASGTATTNASGVAAFSNLDVGMYVVIETAYPDKVTKPSDPFLVSIPMTDPENESQWMYNVYAYPKNSTSEGTVTLKKTDVSGNALVGVSFKLEKQNGSDWALVKNGTLDTYTTNASGEIQFANLAFGTYRLTETAALDGYILDNRPVTFTIDEEGVITCSDSRSTVSSASDPSGLTITMKNEKPTISKTATTSNTAAGVGSVVAYKLEADIPQSIADLTIYTIEDVPTNLKDDVDSITVKVDGAYVSSGAYSKAESGDGFVITFTPAQMAAYAGKKVVITYNATVLSGAAAAGKATNEATLTYTNNIVEKTTNEVKDDDTVYNFAINIVKYKDAIAEANKIAGVEFALYSDEALTNQIKVSGSAGVYTVDPAGTATLTTAAGGKLEIKGLPAGTYYLKETKTIDGYNLLSNAVEIDLNVTVEESGSSVTYKLGTETLAGNAVSREIINKKGFTLPQTGGLGTLMFILIGGVLMAGGIVLITGTGKKRAR